MEKLDPLSLVLIVIGSIMVYGAKHIFKLLKIKSEDSKILIFKLAGLIIACIGFLRIIDII